VSGPLPESASPAPVWPLYRAMVGVGVVCGLLIVGVYLVTHPVIERNRAEALERAILDVLPGAVSHRSFRFAAGEGFAPLAESESGTTGIHAGYDGAGRLAGLAVEAAGMGYQDTIRVLYGYAPEREAIIGFQVLESRETPGLGDRIATDRDFLANFEHLAVALGPEGDSLAHPIEAVKPGRKEHPWQVDGITGATISAVAVADILHRSAGTWVPRLRRHLDDFRAHAPGKEG